jgi:hypothetical protein
MRRYLTPLFLVFTLLCAATAYKLAAPSPIAVVEQPPLTAKQVRARTHHDVDFMLIRRVQCYNAKTGKGGIGTAWVISENTLVTAAHVTNDVCFDIDTQQPVMVKQVDWHNDFAILTMDTGKLPEYITYSCEGFRTGHHYTPVGWADGYNLKQTQVTAQKWKNDKDSYVDDMRAVGLRWLTGKVYHGMSGGPVFDEWGVAVGINSATDNGETAFSRDLRDTVLCGKPRRNDPQHSDIFRN